VAHLAPAGCASAQAPVALPAAAGPQPAGDAGDAGGLYQHRDVDAIERAVTEANAQVTQGCWLPSEERALTSELRVVAQLEVAPDGRISDVVIGAMPAQYPKLKWCIGNVLWKLKFGAAPEPAVLTVALALRAP